MGSTGLRQWIETKRDTKFPRYKIDNTISKLRAIGVLAPSDGYGTAIKLSPTSLKKIERGQPICDRRDHILWAPSARASQPDSRLQ